MESRKECAIAKHSYYNKELKRAKALRDPNLERFTAREVNLAHSIIKQYWGVDARSMSNKSHQFAGWCLANDKETIPYNVALVVRGNRNDAAEEIAARLAAKAQECLDREKDVG